MRWLLNLSRWWNATKYVSSCDQCYRADSPVVYISENAMACFWCAMKAKWDTDYLAKQPRPGTEGGL